MTNDIQNGRPLQLNSISMCIESSKTDAHVVKALVVLADLAGSRQSAGPDGRAHLPDLQSRGTREFDFFESRFRRSAQINLG